MLVLAMNALNSHQAPRIAREATCKKLCQVAGTFPAVVSPFIVLPDVIRQNNDIIPIEISAHRTSRVTVLNV